MASVIIYHVFLLNMQNVHALGQSKVQSLDVCVFFFLSFMILSMSASSSFGVQDVKIMFFGESLTLRNFLSTVFFFFSCPTPEIERLLALTLGLAAHKMLSIFPPNLVFLFVLVEMFFCNEVKLL